MKRFLLILLTLSMLLTAIPFSVSAESDIFDAFYDSLPPWDDKNNYIDYDNEDGHKTEGYRPGKITVFMTEEFMSSHEAPVPEDFNEEGYIYYDEFIVDIIHKDYYDYNEFDIIIDWFLEPFASSVESTIQTYIYTLEDFEWFKSVEKVRANYVVTKDNRYGELTDYQDYDDYYYYKNEDRHKKSGYVTDAIMYGVSEDFASFISENCEKDELGRYILDESVFPELQGKIMSATVNTSGSGSITIQKWADHCTNYSEDHIDSYIEILKYLYDHPLVVYVMPNFILPIVFEPDPPESETDDTTTDTEEETTEAEETTAPETTAPETTTGESENTAQKNHQTGDGLYFLMAAAVLSFALFSFVTALKRRAKNK